MSSATLKIAVTIMHERYYTVAEIEYIRQAVLNEITPEEIAIFLRRPILSVKKKIYIQGFFYESKLRKLKKSQDIVDRFIKNKRGDQADQQILDTKPKEITYEWETALIKYDIIVSENKGVKVMMRYNKPITVQQILELVRKG